MTNPNSASPWREVKFIYFVAFIGFWITIPTTSWAIAGIWLDTLKPAEVSSALTYMLNGMMFIWWVNRIKALPQWLPLPMALAAASVLLLNWDSYWLNLLANASWLLTWGTVLHGEVWPWSVPLRIVFMPTAELDRISSEEKKQTPSS